MEQFFKLFFETDEIPEHLQDELATMPFISKDGKTCCRYIRILAETCQVKLINAFLPWMGPGQLGPGAQLSGAKFATFAGRTVGPRAQLIFAMTFLMIYEYFL